MGGVELDTFTVEEEAGVFCDAGGLLHVVGDDGDGVLGLELEDELFDLRGGDGVERGSGLVHEKNLRVDGEGAGDAHALLLAAGERSSGFFLQVILDLFPESGLLERALDRLVEDAAVWAGPVPSRAAGLGLASRSRGRGWCWEKPRRRSGCDAE